ncbi:hypothetical protein [Mangrovibacterium lignilyticum]|uniref:hypothetical protein n=1 Tax=Mangrovibacterium lignilyticum TaxID=2668052 RepID=UPI0013D42A9D|nr:hypothetical protein [Mangrovibacterium lignilyticum]
MNTRNLKIYSLLLGMVLALFACQPDEFSLGKILSKEDLTYRITQDANDPNMVILESLTPGATPLWVTPMGRSSRVKDTLRFPFPGDYEFIYGVESAGGLVQADAFPLSITTTNLSYVSDQFWVMLTGGAGNSKTWISDTGEYGKKQGFYSCYDPAATWDDMVNDNGNWKPEGYVWWEPSNGDVGNTAADLAQFMTFSLASGAADYTLGSYTADDLNLTNYQPEDVAKGNFNFDSGSKSIEVSGDEDVQFAHGQWAHLNSLSWNKDFKILMLTDDVLMIANLRDEGLSGEGPCWYVWNFVSREYAESYVPADLPDPEPALPDGWQGDISQVVSTTITWKLSEENPFDWANLDGSLMNGWQAPGDYPDWLGGTLDPSTYANFSMTMNSSGNSVVFVTPDGTSTEGTYSIDEKGIYSFDITVPTITIVGWAGFSADADNQLRITKIEKDASGAVAGMWLGNRNPDKPEYMAYHLVPQFGGGEVDPTAVWKNALKGKTLVPDINYFADWYLGDWTGGWTASLFPDDFTSQSWFWTQENHDACVASSISFYMDGDVLKADAVDNGTAKTGITVEIDPDNGTLMFSEAPFTYSWIFTNNGEGMGPWLFGSHDGASLSNIDTKGMYLGFYTGFDDTNPELPTEVTAFHMVLSN